MRGLESLRPDPIDETSRFVPAGPADDPADPALERRRGPAGRASRDRARCRAQAAPGDRAVRRHPGGRVLLAARRRPQGRGHAGLPRGGECLDRRGDGPAQAAAGHALRRDRRPHQAGRQLGALPRARLVVLLALREGQGLPGACAPPGRPGHRCAVDPGRQRARRLRRRTGAARRQRHGRGQGLLQRRRLCRQPGQPDPGVGRRCGRPPPVHDPLPRPGNGQGMAGDDRGRFAQPRLGRRPCSPCG